MTEHRRLQGKTLQRYRFLEDQTGKLRVDPKSGTLFGVRLLGADSMNNRRYTESALQDAARLYSGVVVNCNHSRQSRDVEDRIGKVLKAWVKGNAVYGDVQLLKSHPMTPRVLEAAADPAKWSLFAFSHDCQGDGHTAADGKFICERIDVVNSCDLVADGATNSGLTERRNRR